MWPLFVVVVNPCTQREARVLNRLITTNPSKLLFKGFNEAFTETVFLRRIRRDVFLLQSVVANDSSVLA